MRYVIVPPEVRCKNSLTGEPLMIPDERGGMKEDVWTFTKAVRAATWVASQKASADALELMDVRKKFEDADVGSVVKLSDSEWKSITEEFKRPAVQIFGPGYGLSAESHIRAWLEAPTKDPGTATVEIPKEN